MSATIDPPDDDLAWFDEASLRGIELTSQSLDAPAAPAFDDTRLRPADAVVGRARAAAAAPTPLSFARSAMRAVVQGRWRIRKDRIELDERGRGEVLYRVEGGGRTFHFFLLSDELPESVKTDRNFAASWDAMGVLCEGRWTPGREARLRHEVPRQRAGWADYGTLMYARGNRSARLFEHVVERLAEGRQPDARVIAPVGYVLRTTAFIGNGQLGTRPLAEFDPGHPLRAPYHAQFVSAWVLREFVFDLVDHMARARSPRAARLSYAHRRYLGLGNSAATGLVAYLANHPRQLHHWCVAHERALAQACATPAAGDDPRRGRLHVLLDRAIVHHAEAAHDGDGRFEPPQRIATDLSALREALPSLLDRSGDTPWPALREHAAARLSRDACEVLDAILLELHPEAVAAHEATRHVDEDPALDPTMTAAELAAILARDLGWALAPQAPASTHFWYRTTRTPRDIRRARRGIAPHFEVETTLDTPLRAAALRDALAAVPADRSIGELLLARPELRAIARRVQALAGHPYGELRANPLDARFDPFEPIRLVLALYGLEKFEAAPPKSVRGTFLQGAPIAEDVAHGHDGDWPYPRMPADDAPADGPPPLPDPKPRVARTAVAAPATEPRRVAPDELARMLRIALQGHGATLGEAQDIADLVAFTARLDVDAVTAALDDCARGRIAIARDRRLLARGPSFARVDAAGASLIAVAPAALDLAVADLHHGGLELGAVRLDRVVRAAQAAAIVRQAAVDGRHALLAWADGGRCGFAVGEPGGGFGEFATGTLAIPCALLDAGSIDAVLALLRAGPAASLAAASRAEPGTPCALLVCGRADSPLASVATLAVAAELDPDAALWPVSTLGRRLFGVLANGVVLPRIVFDALEAAGRTLLMPADDEPSVLPPGVDPVKVF